VQAPLPRLGTTRKRTKGERAGSAKNSSIFSANRSRAGGSVVMTCSSPQAAGRGAGQSPETRFARASGCRPSTALISVSTFGFTICVMPTHLGSRGKIGLEGRDGLDGPLADHYNAAESAHAAGVQRPCLGRVRAHSDAATVAVTRIHHR
jgi:hypothetical protein